MFTIPTNPVKIDYEKETDDILKDIFSDSNFLGGSEFSSHTVYIEDYKFDGNDKRKKIHRENMPNVISQLKNAGYFCHYEYNRINGNCYGFTVTKIPTKYDI